MPPKKKPGKDESSLDDKEQLLRAETEIASLQRLLEIKTHETVEAKQQERIWRSRASTAEATLQQMQQDMAEIVADMKRQHEAALQATQQRMQQLEAREAELLRLMEGKEAAVKELAAKHSETCKDRDIQIASYQRRLEALQLEFAAMLKTTLEKLHGRLDEQHAVAMTASAALPTPKPGPARRQVTISRVAVDAEASDLCDA